MIQFDEFENQPMACAVCEAMCPEAVDGTLSAAEQQAFEKHVAGCVACAQELEEAQRGAAWMAMLKGQTPEPPAALLQRILAETTGAQAAVAPMAAPVFAQPVFAPPVLARPSGRAVQWTAMRAKLTEVFSLDAFRVLMQPRLAMTAAMAFFSIALTMNMAGIRLTDLRAGALRPSTLRRTLADAGASATRNFQNLPVVYKVESRVSEMRNNSGFERDDHRDPGGPFGPASEPKSSGTTTPQSAPDQNQQQEKTAPQSTPQGKSELELPVQPGTVARKGA